MDKAVWSKLLYGLRLGLVAYGTLAAYGWWGSDRQIFMPPPASYADDGEILKLESAQGETIAAQYWPPLAPEDPRLMAANTGYTVLYSHGNGEDLGDNRLLLSHLQAYGFAVLVYDYPGYGHSGGKPSEAGAYEAIDTAYHYLVDDLGVSPGRIIGQGRSVGSGPTVELARRQPLGGVILESAFVSTFRVVTHVRLLPFDKFANLAKISQVQCPVLVIHGTEDQTIPFWHGEALFAAIAAPKQAFWVEGADHNDLVWVAGDRYFETMRQFALDLPSP